MHKERRPSRKLELEKLAEKISSMKLEAPILFFLEINKPLCTLAHTASLLFEPLATPFLGNERIRNLQFIFEDRENLEYFTKLIETSQLKREAA